MFNDIELIMLSKSSPPEFFKLLYKKIGQEGFENSKKLNAYISDLLVDSNGVKQRIRYAIAANMQYYILREPFKQIEKTRFKQIVALVKEKTGMSDEFAEEFVGLFAYATGRIATFNHKRTYYSSLHPVKIKGKYGYADDSNNIVINPQYDKAKPFMHDRAKVCISRKYGFIDRSGDEIIQIIYDNAEDFVGETTEVTLNEQKYVIDMDGNIVNQKE